MTLGLPLRTSVYTVLFCVMPTFISTFCKVRKHVDEVSSEIAMSFILKFLIFSSQENDVVKYSSEGFVITIITNDLVKKVIARRLRL